MSWIRIDSGLWRDPRWRSLSPGARALFVDLLGISGDRDSDGAVDRTAFALATVDLAPGEAVSIAEELVSAGFLEVCGTGRQVVDPFAYLRPRSEVEADRRQRVEAAALGGAARGRDGARGPDGKYVKPAAPAENPAERVAERVERVDQPTSQPQASPVTVPVPVGRKVSIPSLTPPAKNGTVQDDQPTWASVDQRRDCESFRASTAYKAWRRRWKYPPSDRQLAILEPICEAHPDPVGGWISEAPAGSTYAAVQYIQEQARKANDAAKSAQIDAQVARRKADRADLEARLAAMDSVRGGKPATPEAVST
jgi:hypothetical protein